ncbi:hypothetical protein KKHLCK_12960 [Candidatus Electrothrix laxa]
MDRSGEMPKLIFPAVTVETAVNASFSTVIITKNGYRRVCPNAYFYNIVNEYMRTFFLLLQQVQVLNAMQDAFAQRTNGHLGGRKSEKKH